MAVDTGRLGRVLALIGFVSVVFLFTANEVFEGRVFSVAVVAIGSVALVTGIIGALIAAAGFEDIEER